MQLPDQSTFPWKELFINFVVFFLSFYVFMYAFTFLGWNPQKELAKDKQKLSMVEIMMVIFVAIMISLYICLFCSPVKDGVVSGFVFAVCIQLMYQYKLKRLD